MRILAGFNYVITTFVFLIMVWQAVIGVTVVSEAIHFGLLFFLPIQAISLMCIAFGPK